MVNVEIDLGYVINVGVFDFVQKFDVDLGFFDDYEYEYDLVVGFFIFEEMWFIDFNFFLFWLNEVVQMCGQDFYWIKGIFYVRGFKECVVFQSVWMLMIMCMDCLWIDDELCVLQFVVIGKNFDCDVFVDGFVCCVVGQGVVMIFILGLIVSSVDIGELVYQVYVFCCMNEWLVIYWRGLCGVK